MSGAACGVVVRCLIACHDVGDHPFTDFPQHCTSTTKHSDNAKKGVAHFWCSICKSAHVNGTVCAASALPIAAPLASKVWHCNACDEDIPSDPISVKSHNASSKHQRQNRWDAEQGARELDGTTLANSVRHANQNSNQNTKWIKVKKKDGTSVNKQVTVKQSAAGSGGKNDVC